MELLPESELVFSRNAQANGNPRQNLTIINSQSDATLAFKVKTTAPKQFVVRPNAGKLSPGEKVEVAVILQLKDGAAVDTKRKDKFLVQAIKIPSSLLQAGLDEAGFQIKIAELWAQTEQVKKSVADGAGSDIILEKKLRCSYQLDDFGASPSKDGSEISAKATLNARASVYNTDEASEASAAAPAASATSPNSFQEPATATSTTSVVPTSSHNASLEKALKELKDAKDKITSLQSACEGYKVELDRVNLLRQRRADAVVPPTSTVTPTASKQVHKSASNSFNIQILALVAFISFIVGAWLF
ncbi:phosphatidylinositol-binding protein scs2 [Kappamyces sp. JEL0680]|nr:phosphatidylinositol-binding protein scs2 [Kappamyces sp. JEL0680]